MMSHMCQLCDDDGTVLRCTSLPEMMRQTSQLWNDEGMVITSFDHNREHLQAQQQYTRTDLGNSCV